MGKTNEKTLYEQKTNRYPKRTTFQIGKFYKYDNGKMIHILSRVETTGFANTLLAETNEPIDSFIPIGEHEGTTDGWIEITRKEWMNNFSNE